MAKKLASDRFLFLPVLALCALGLLMIYSASAMQTHLPTPGAPKTPTYFFAKQLVFLLVGLALVFSAMAFDYKKLNDPIKIAIVYGAVCLSLVAVLFTNPINGARRWLPLGLASLQPSEFAKVALAVAVAAFLSRRESEIDHPTRTLLPAIALVAVPGALVLIEPDFGTALTYGVLVAAMLFYAGLRLRWLLSALAVSLPVIAFMILRSPYRRERLTTFLSPDADPFGSGFHILQSLIAVGTGGVTGLGVGEGRAKLFFLPYPYTDFIYAIIGEELGLLGCVCVLALFGLVVARGLRAAENAPDSFGRLLGVGLTVMIGVQAFVNISVVLGLVPTKGIPLPFVSYGGSALLADLISVGILLNLSQHSS